MFKDYMTNDRYNNNNMKTTDKIQAKPKNRSAMFKKTWVEK